MITVRTACGLAFLALCFLKVESQGNDFAETESQGEEIPDAFSWSDRLQQLMRENYTFVEAVSKLGHDLWDKFWQTRKDHGKTPWIQKQCSATGAECRKRCSCFDMMNMAEKWLAASKVSPEEYRQCFRRAAKLHHPDKGGSEEGMRFLTDCATLLCGDERCRNPGTMPRQDQQRKAAYIKEMKRIKTRCKKRSMEKGVDAGVECHSEKVEELNDETWDMRGSKARDDVRNPRNNTNAFRGHEEELMVCMSNTAIRATLIWDNCNDVDLHVQEPGGFEIYYSTKRSPASHGFLDIDRNVGSSCDARPVENVRWEIGASSPIPGHYKVLVNLFSHDSRSPRNTPFQLEVSHGPDVKHFQGAVSEVRQKQLVHSFEYGPQSSQQSKELFSSSVECVAWTTYMWEYVYKVLLSASTSNPAKTWDVILVTDGEDNDSPDAFFGPSGFNEMMNKLHERSIRPRISVYCIGTEHCTGDANGMHFYRDLVLASGGVFVADMEESSDTTLVRQFAVQLTGSVDERDLTAKQSQQEWLRLSQSGAHVVNQNEPYTQALVQKGAQQIAKKPTRKKIQEHQHCVTRQCLCGGVSDAGGRWSFQLLTGVHAVTPHRADTMKPQEPLKVANFG
eukprot:symbB.v1.2.036945.t1/scaffold5337.1/size28304/2